MNSGKSPKPCGRGRYTKDSGPGLAVRLLLDKYLSFFRDPPTRVGLWPAQRRAIGESFVWRGRTIETYVVDDRVEPRAEELRAAMRADSGG